MSRLPNKFLAPVAGLMRLNSGLIAVSDGRNPTCATFAMTPTATHTPAIGPTVRASVSRTVISRF